MAKDRDKIFRELRKQGFLVKPTKKNHHRVTKDGVFVALFSGSASDWRSDLNSLADCRRGGFIWPPPKK